MGTGTQGVWAHIRGMGTYIHTATMTRVSQLWDLIETWGFREDIKDIVAVDNDIDDNDVNDNYDDDDNIDVDDDNDDDDDSDDVDVADADDNNDKESNDDKGISALGLDRDMGFS